MKSLEEMVAALGASDQRKRKEERVQQQERQQEHLEQQHQKGWCQYQQQGNPLHEILRRKKQPLLNYCWQGIADPCCCDYALQGLSEYPYK